MCGIVGGISFRNVGSLLLQGLKRLEYRGYDSAGIAVITQDDTLECLKIKGKVNCLNDNFLKNPINGICGLAHTRWATHGIPSKENAHPHISNDSVAVVHNGIIENYDKLKRWLIAEGYQFISQTDSEVIAHLVHFFLNKDQDLLTAVQSTVKTLEGMFAIGVISVSQPDSIIAARSGSPLVIGLGKGENFIASDNLALLPLTNRFIFLDEGDIAIINKDKVTVVDKNNHKFERKIYISNLTDSMIDRSKYKHYMEKEIFEQASSVAKTLEGRITKDKILDTSFGIVAPERFKQIQNVYLVACGTSYNAALMAKYWLEERAGVSCEIEIASEYRYRHAVIQPNSLFVVLSQSGETADTLASFRIAKDQHYVTTLAICNVPESSLVRESELIFLTRAGPEIGVASTKSFLTQLCALLLLTVSLGRHHQLDREAEKHIVRELSNLPNAIEQVLNMKDQIEKLAQELMHKEHMIVLGRGSLFPIALEGALKLKEITYIHAEAYAAGELKHGPLAMVDRDMPVVILAPTDDLYDKLKSNLEEVKARGGQIYVFADDQTDIVPQPGVEIFKLPSVDALLMPFLYVIPLQLLSYYIGILKGTDVDQPRNLAKSVTVE
jgi:glucosamine--fructose-6-phosphate aminotransferase (isomerizing)